MLYTTQSYNHKFLVILGHFSLIAFYLLYKCAVAVTLQEVKEEKKNQSASLHLLDDDVLDRVVYVHEEFRVLLFNHNECFEQ